MGILLVAGDPKVPIALLIREVLQPVVDVLGQLLLGGLDGGRALAFASGMAAAAAVATVVVSLGAVMVVNPLPRECPGRR